MITVDELRAALARHADGAEHWRHCGSRCAADILEGLPAPDALTAAVHIVEQQGLALGRLRAAARDHGLCSCGDFGGPRPLGGGREYHYSGCDYDPALRAAIEEVAS